MKLSRIVAVGASAVLAFGLAACSNDGTDSEPAPTSTSKAAAPKQAPLPTVEELDAILATAADPNAPQEEKVKTVQGGEFAPEIFEVMAASKEESGAEFQVVPPVLPNYDGSVLTTVNFLLPGHEPQPAENVEFVYEDGRWKLSQMWACTLVTNTVEPEQVPAVCRDGEAPAEEAPEGAAEEGMPEGAAEEGMPEEAPAEAPAS